MVFAFGDHGRQQEVRRLAARVKALEDALRGMRDYYREHVISGVLYKQVEDALGETLSQPGNRGPDEVRPPDGGRSPVGEQPLIRRPSGIG